MSGSTRIGVLSGTLAWVLTALLLGPARTIFQGTVQSVVTFFCFFVTFAAGYFLVSMVAKSPEDEEGYQ